MRASLGNSAVTGRRVATPAAVAACVMLCSCGAVHRRVSSSCDAHRDRAALVTADVLVYPSRLPAGAATIYFACRRPAGAPEEVGLDRPGSLYGSDATTGGFAAAGTEIVAQSSRGVATLAMCARYTTARRCPPARYWLTVIDTANGRRAALRVYAGLRSPALVPFPVPVALCAQQAVAWLERSVSAAGVGRRSQLWAATLWPRDETGVLAARSLIDVGAIDPSSLHFTGRTLTWTRAGRIRHRSLS